MIKERIIMGMTVRIEVADENASEEIFEKLFAFFDAVDRKFSTYKEDSEISKINRGLIQETNFTEEMKEVLRLAEETKRSTDGYFDILTPEMKLDPSGIVKGWAILKASKILKSEGYSNFYIDAGGDIEAQGKSDGQSWQIGIRNPLTPSEVVKVVSIENKGIATSGNYVRGEHIYNPKIKNKADAKSDSKKSDILSLTVIGPNIYEADRFATAAFAMGPGGIYFIENLSGFEGYAIDKEGIATMTSGFESYVQKI